MSSAKIRVWLLAGAALTGAALAASPVAAAVTTTVFKASIFDSYGDPALFDLPGDSLNGREAILSFSFDPDTAGSNRQTGADSDLVSGDSFSGTTSPFTSASMTVNGKTVSFGFEYASSAQNLRFSDQSQVRRDVRSYEENPYFDTILSITAAAGADVFPVSLETGIPLTATGGEGGFSYVQCASPCTEYVTYFGGKFLPTSVETPGTIVPPVPLPAALPLLVTGFGGLGFVARRRRAHG